MRSTHMKFIINKCENSAANTKCTTDTAAIKTFVDDLQVDMWVMHEKMDFLDRIKKPTFKLNDVLTSMICDSDAKTVD